MKIKVIRSLLAQYDQTSVVYKYFYPSIYAYSNEIKALRDFSAKLKNQPDDYELTTADLFKLLKVVSAIADCELVADLKKSLNQSHLLDIFSTLDSMCLMTTKRFLTIHALSSQRLALLYDLFCNPARDHLSLTKESLDGVLKLLSKDYYVRAHLENILRKFDWHKLLTKDAFALLDSAWNQLSCLNIIVTYLDHERCLNKGSIAILKNLGELYTLSNIITLLRNNKIEMDSSALNLLNSKPRLELFFNQISQEATLVALKSAGKLTAANVKPLIAEQLADENYPVIPTTHGTTFAKPVTCATPMGAAQQLISATKSYNA